MLWKRSGASHAGGGSTEEVKTAEISCPQCVLRGSTSQLCSKHFCNYPWHFGMRDSEKPFLGSSTMMQYGVQIEFTVVASGSFIADTRSSHADGWRFRQPRPPSGHLKSGSNSCEKLQHYYCSSGAAVDDMPTETRNPVAQW